jgi:hypothetical protein
LRARVIAFREAAARAADAIIAAEDARQHAAAAIAEARQHAVAAAEEARRHAVAAVEEVHAAQRHAMIFFGEAADDPWDSEAETDEGSGDFLTSWMAGFCRVLLCAQVLDDINCTASNLATGHLVTGEQYLNAGNMIGCRDDLDGLLEDLNFLIDPTPAKIAQFKEQERNLERRRAEYLRAQEAAGIPLDAIDVAIEAHRLRAKFGLPRQFGPRTQPEEE